MTLSEMARSGSSFLLAHDDTSEHEFAVRYDIQSDILPGRGLEGGRARGQLELTPCLAVDFGPEPVEPEMNAD